jgi:hypothetical protein
MTTTENSIRGLTIVQGLDNTNENHQRKIRLHFKLSLEYLQIPNYHYFQKISTTRKISTI